jgi:glyoxylase-like metal-dependent hydrolase (beta-lactamase superfamily II)
MQVADGVWLVDDLRSSHVYLLQASDGVVVVDTSMRGSHDTIERTLHQVGYTFEDVCAILITHAHVDHIGSLPELQRLTQAPIYAAAGEIPSIEGRAPLPHPPGVYGQLFRAATSPLRPAPVAVQHTLQAGPSLPFLPNWHVIPTPGHTPDHISLYQSQLQLLITGDALTNFGGLRGSPLPFTSNMRTARKSVAQLAGLPVRSMVFGHGQPILDEASLNVQLASLARSLRS